VHHPRFLTLFSNEHVGRGRRCLLAFAFACAAFPNEEIAKATAGEQEKQKANDQANNPFAVRVARGVVICQECDRTAPYGDTHTCWLSRLLGRWGHFQLPLKKARCP